MSKEESGTFTISENKNKNKRKVILIVVFSLIIALCLGLYALTVINSKHKISSEAEFIECFENGFSSKPGFFEVKSYVLTNDITITHTDLKNPDMKMYEVGIENGKKEDKARITNGYNDTITFDGGGHTIKNLTLSGYCASLFGKVGTNASSSDADIVIKNVIFDNLTINGKGATGALISYLNEGSTATFQNVKIINSTIRCEEEVSVGGLIGTSNEGKLIVKNCTIENSTVIAENATNVGGIAGSINNHPNPAKISTISFCNNINTEVKGLKNVGGIVGEYKDNWFSGKDANGNVVDEDIIEFKCLENSGKIYASETTAGGIMGSLSHGNDLNITFESCKTNDGNAPTISSTSNVGGILGATNYNRDGFVVATGSQLTFNNCENNQMLYANEKVGGIVGFINNKFWDVKFIGSTNNRIINGGSKTGGIAGAIDGTIINGKQFSFTNCENKASVLGRDLNSSFVGGILGYNDDLNPLFSNCKNLSISSSFITGRAYVGGISGQYGTFIDCENSMDIKHNDVLQTSWNYVGGIVGSGDGSTFTNCVNIGDIIDYSKSTGVSATHIGGIAGFTNQLVMINCSNSGTVSGSAYVGGLIGKVTTTYVLGPKNELKNCSNTGNIYAFGQKNTSLENFTNDDIDDVNGKIGVLIGYFDTGERIVDFDAVTADANIYIINDTDFVGGWTGYCAQSGGSAIKNNNTNSNILYKIYFSQNVSNVCKTNIKYGEKAFNEVILGFNNPTLIETFNYTED